jgi:F-type H+-transporting ATPase subunit b
MSGFESIVGVNPWTAFFTFCNMIITFLLLKKFLFKPVKKMIDDRQHEIDNLYSDATSSKEEAAALCEEYQQHLTNAKKERDEIIKDAVSKANKREQEIIAGANADANAIREKAHADVMQEKKKVLNEAKNEISDIAMDIASKVIEKEIDAEKHQSLVEEFIEKMGDNE